MKVLLLANYANDGQESMQRFASLMARGLLRAGHEVQSLRPPACIGQLHPSAHGFGKWLGYVDKFGVFPPLLRSAVKSADVVHICDHSNSFYTRYMRSVPHIVTCHDLLAIRSAQGDIPQKQTGWTGRRLQRLIVKGLTGAQHIVCVSEATRRDLLRVIDIPEVVCRVPTTPSIIPIRAWRRTRPNSGFDNSASIRVSLSFYMSAATSGTRTVSGYYAFSPFSPGAWPDHPPSL